MQNCCQSGQAPILSLWSKWHKHAQLITFRSKHSQRGSHALRLSSGKTDRHQDVCIRCGAAGSNRPSLDQSPGLMEGIQEQKEQTKWATATVTQNRHCPDLALVDLQCPHCVLNNNLPLQKCVCRWMHALLDLVNRRPGMCAHIINCMQWLDPKSAV